MIRPGLFTASTSKADPSECPASLFVFAFAFASPLSLLLFGVVVFVFKRECFPLVVTLAATGAAKHTRRAATQSRSRRLVLCGWRGQCERRGGNYLKKSRLEWNGVECGRGLLKTS